MTANSYDYPQCGPWGISLNEQLGQVAQLNSSFSQRGWEDAKQSGCLPQPCAPYPTWPPPQRNGFVYPVSDEQPQVVQGEMFVQEPPFVDSPEPRQKPAPMFCSNPTGSSSSQPLSYSQAQTVASQLINNSPSAPLGLPFVPNQPEIQTKSHEKMPQLLESSPPTESNITPTPHSPSLSHDEKDCSKLQFKTVLPCTWNSFLGFIYDMRHFSQLPSHSSWGKLRFASTRDHRGFYLLFLILLVFLSVALIRTIL